MFRTELDAQRAAGPKCEEGTFEDSANWKRSPVRGFDFSTLIGSFAALQLRGGTSALISPVLLYTEERWLVASACYKQRFYTLLPSVCRQHPTPQTINLFVFHLGLWSRSLLLIIIKKKIRKIIIIILIALLCLFWILVFLPVKSFFLSSTSERRLWCCGVK